MSSRTTAVRVKRVNMSYNKDGCSSKAQVLRGQERDRDREIESTNNLFTSLSHTQTHTNTHAHRHTKQGVDLEVSQAGVVEVQ